VKGTKPDIRIFDLELPVLETILTLMGEHVRGRKRAKAEEWTWDFSRSERVDYLMQLI
jgi:hypothetical protein